MNIEKLGRNMEPGVLGWHLFRSARDGFDTYRIATIDSHNRFACSVKVAPGTCSRARPQRSYHFARLRCLLFIVSATATLPFVVAQAVVPLLPLRDKHNDCDNF